MAMNRRAFLGLAGGAVAAIPLLSSCGEGGLLGSSTGALLSSDAKLPEPFGVPLPVPPVLAPTRTDVLLTTTRSPSAPEPPRCYRASLQRYGGTTGSSLGPPSCPTAVAALSCATVTTAAVPVSVHLHGGKTPPEHYGLSDRRVSTRAGGRHLVVPRPPN